MKKSTFLVVWGAGLVFILAEDEIAREIMSLPQFMFSSESEAADGAASLGASWWKLGGGPPVPSTLSPWVQGLWLEETTAAPPLLSALGWTSHWVSMEAIREMRPLKICSLLEIVPSRPPNTRMRAVSSNVQSE